VRIKKPRSDAGLKKWLGSLDPNQALLWMIEQGLENLDPVRQQERADRKQERRKKRQDERLAQAQARKAGAGASADETPVQGAAPQGAAAENALAQGSALHEESAGQKEPAPECESPESGAGPAQKDDAVFLEFPDAPSHKRARAHLPVSVRRRVWLKYQGRCQFRDPLTGRLCGATAFLDIDHIQALFEGGDDSEENLTLACRLHNRRRPFWKPSEQPLRPGQSPAQAQAR
jgi:hypothetical protein